MNFKLPKIVSTIVGVVVLFIFAVWYAATRQRGVEARLTMESDAMSMVNYYVPRRIRLTATPAEGGLTLPAFHSPKPQFGALHMGNGSDTVISLAVDEGPNGYFLYVDKNNNEDLTDDDDPLWDDDKGEYRLKEVLVDVSYRDGRNQRTVPYPVVFYRYKNRLPDAVVAYRNGYRKGVVSFADSTCKVALLDDDLNGLFDEWEKGMLIVDRNGDGILDGQSGSDELLPLNAVFGMGRSAYRIAKISPSGDHIVFVEADTGLAAPPPLQEDTAAPIFRALDLAGNPLDLSAYRGQVVCIDFGATWCKPWLREVPDLKRVYRKYHSRGLEIISISLDYDAGLLKAYVEKNGISWPQIATGEGWESGLVGLYRVRALPKRFLLDRRGTIRYIDTPAKQLDGAIYTLLNEPKVSESSSP